MDADYSDVIREPVDLGTIRERLDQEGCGGYTMLADVTDDVVLVFKNAMTYNIEKSQIHEDASDSLKAFEADLAASLERVCTKGVEALQPADQQAGADKEKRDDAGNADVQADNGLRPQYVAPQVVASILQSKLEEWDRRPNWIDSFDHNLPLPSGWSVVHDQKTSKVYYWNKPANHTQWEQPKPPAVILPTPLPERAPVNAAKALPGVRSTEPQGGGHAAPAATERSPQTSGDATHNLVVADGTKARAPEASTAPAHAHVEREEERGDLSVGMGLDGAHALPSSQVAGASGREAGVPGAMPIPNAGGAQHIQAEQAADAERQHHQQPFVAENETRLPQRKQVHPPSPYVGRYSPLVCSAGMSVIVWCLSRGRRPPAI